MRRQEMFKGKTKPGHAGQHGGGQKYGCDSVEPLSSEESEHHGQPCPDSNQAEHHVHKRVCRGRHSEDHNVRPFAAGPYIYSTRYISSTQAYVPTRNQSRIGATISSASELPPQNTSCDIGSCILFQNSDYQ